MPVESAQIRPTPFPLEDLEEWHNGAHCEVWKVQTPLAHRQALAKQHNEIQANNKEASNPSPSP